MHAKEKLLRETDEVPVYSCLGLLAGDEITARHMGTLLHRGRVTDIAPDQGFFWIMDDLSGGRRLLDLSEVQVMRIKGEVTEKPPPAKNG